MLITPLRAYDFLFLLFALPFAGIQVFFGSQCLYLGRILLEFMEIEVEISRRKLNEALHQVVGDRVAPLYD